MDIFAQSCLRCLTRSYEPMLMVTKFLHGFHKATSGTTRSEKIELYINSYFSKALWRRLGCYKLRSGDNKHFVIIGKRCYYYSFSGCNWTRTHNHLVHKRTLNHLAKLAKMPPCFKYHNTF